MAEGTVGLPPNSSGQTIRIETGDGTNLIPTGVGEEVVIPSDAAGTLTAVCAVSRTGHAAIHGTAKLGGTVTVIRTTWEQVVGPQHVAVRKWEFPQTIDL